MENNNATATKVEDPFQVTMKNPKKVKQGKRLAKFNSREKEQLAQVA